MRGGGSSGTALSAGGRRRGCSAGAGAVGGAARTGDAAGDEGRELGVVDEAGGDGGVFAGRGGVDGARDEVGRNALESSAV